MPMTTTKIDEDVMEFVGGSIRIWGRVGGSGHNGSHQDIVKVMDGLDQI